MSTSVLMRAMDRSVARIESVDDLGRAMDAIRRDVAGASRARWNGVEPQPYVFRGGTNSLYFAHPVTTLDGTPTSEVVALREIVTPGGPTLVRSTARLPARAASFGDIVFGAPQALWTGAARLRFAYVSRHETNGAMAPQFDWPTGTKMPEAVLVEAIDRKTRKVLVAARITIEANADIGCLGASEAPAATPATAANGAASSTDVAPGAGGVEFGAIPAPQALPPPIPPPGAAAAAGPGTDDGFCGRSEDADDHGTPPDAKPRGPSEATVAAGVAP